MSSQHQAESNSESDEDECNYYSGQARRFEVSKKAMYPAGFVQLITEDKEKDNRKRSNSVDLDESVSLEILEKNSKIAKLESAPSPRDVTNITKHVETLDDLEEYVNLSPDITLCDNQDKYSSSPPQIIYEEELSPLDVSLQEIDKESQPQDVYFIKVRFRSKVMRLELKKNHFFKNISQQLSEMSNMDADKISLFLNDKLLDPYDTLITIPIGITDVIDAFITTEKTETEQQNQLSFKIQSQQRGSSMTISIRKQDPLRVLMEKYCEKAKMNMSNLRFKFDGEILPENETPESFDLEGGECIDVYFV